MLCRALSVILPLALTTQAAELRIDHVTVAGRDLAAMRQAFAAATGVAPEYGGAHANHATEMALASFADGSYLELMGLQQRADPVEVAGHTWDEIPQEQRLSARSRCGCLMSAQRSHG